MSGCNEDVPAIPATFLASRRQTACFVPTVDIRDKTQAGFAQIVGIILQQIVTKVFESFFSVLLYRHLNRAAERGSVG